MINGKHDQGDALLSLQPNGQWTFTDVDDFSTLTWHTSEVTQPTKEECEAEIKKLDDNYVSKEYQRQRQYEYPEIGEQLDYIYHNGIEKWKTDIVDPVKTKYPKPS